MAQTNKKSVSKKPTSNKPAVCVNARARKEAEARRSQASKKPSSKLSKVDQVALAKLIDNPRAPTLAMLKAYARYQELLV